jgi:uncharacterized protein (TIGR02147 family)
MRNTGPASVFSFNDYRKFIRADIASNKGERGYQKKLANAAKCRPSYLSQVLNSHIQLTMDQAASLCEFWSFNEDRTEFFLALVQCERSSSKTLKDFLLKKISNLQRKHQQVSERVSPEERVSSRDDRLSYYSNWLFPAVHVLASAKEFQTAEMLAQRLNVPKQLLHTVVDELIRMGFVKEEAGRISSLVRNIHVNRDSPLNISNHFQWRHRSLNKVVEGDPRSVHYSTLYAMSRADIDILREMLLDFIERTRKLVAPSQEEDVVCLLTDFFYV